MEERKNNRGVIILLVVIVLILGLLCVLLATGKIRLKSDKVHDNQVIDNSGSEIVQEYKIELTKEKEMYTYDNLTLNFNGSLMDNSSDYYEYTLNMKIGARSVTDTFFTDKKDSKIWSSNMAAEFYVYKIDNVYIIKSFRAAQCGSNDVLIVNKAGQVLQTFKELADVKFAGKIIQISYCGKPMDSLDDIKIDNYVVNGSSITLVND